MAKADRGAVLGPKTFLPGFLVALFAAVSLWVPSSAIAQGPGDSDASNAWAGEERDLTVEHDASGFRFESQRQTDIGWDEFRGDFRLADARIETVLVSTKEGEEAVLRLTLRFVSLLEYKDLDQDGRYGLGDTVTQRLDLTNRPGTDLLIEPRLDGGFSATARYPFNASEPIVPPFGNAPPLEAPGLRVGFWISPREQDGLLPTEVALSTVIDRFPFTDNETQIALEARLDSNLVLGTASDQLEATAFPFATLYQWERDSFADGRPFSLGVLVIESPDDSEGAERPGSTALFSHPRGDRIEHAATLGVQRFDVQALPLPSPVARIIVGAAGPYLIGALLTLLVVGGTALGRLRGGR